MARKKPTNVVPLNSLDDVNARLFKIAQLKTKLKRIDADAEEKLNKIKDKAAKEAEPLLNELETHENSILAYSEYNRDNLFDKKKSIELPFGFIGYRKSTKIIIKNTTLAKLKEMDMSDCILVKETPNKDVLALRDDAILKQVDARRKVDEKFWYEVKEEEITNTSAKVVSDAGNPEAA